MWEKMKLVMSEIFNFIWPVVKQMLVKSAPMVKAAAMAAVTITINKYAGTLVSNTEKHEDAYGMIVDNLKQQGLVIGRDFTESMIDLAIASAVKALTGQQ